MDFLSACTRRELILLLGACLAMMWFYNAEEVSVLERLGVDLHHAVPAADSGSPQQHEDASTVSTAAGSNLRPKASAPGEWFWSVRQCEGLHAAPARSVMQCMTTCFSRPACCDWQFHQQHGCWIGRCAGLLEAIPTDWVGLSARGDCTSAAIAGDDSVTSPLSQPGGRWNDVHGELAVVAVVRNAAKRIREWLAFHVTQGVDHFFIVDDESTDRLAEALAPAVRKGYVTLLPASLMAAKILHPLRFHTWQSTIYNNVFLRFGSFFRWFGVWDVDEYMYSSGAHNLPGTLRSMLARFPDASGVCVNWEIMGSMGLRNRSDGLLTETFTEVVEDSSHVKCVALSERTHDVWVHNHRSVGRYKQYLETGEEVRSHTAGSAENLAGRELHLNHYYHVSREEFAARIAASRWPYKKVEHWNAGRGRPQRPGIQGYMQAVQKVLAEWREDDNGAAAGRLKRNYSAWDSGI